jgi:Clp amino terminal domain, pathogenicity island component
MTLDKDILNEARELRSRLLELQHDADRAKLDYHHAIRRLHAAGGSMREIAEELDLSHQRVHQIVEGDEPIHTRIGWKPARRHRQHGLGRFTRVARQVVMRAQKEAHVLGSEDIAPEHLLIGLARVERGTAARALAAQGVDVDRLRSEVGGEPVREPSRGRLPFSTEAKDVLESSLREAQALKNNWIGSEHILLALLSAGGRPVELLEKLEVRPDALRSEVDRIQAEAQSA